MTTAQESKSPSAESTAAMALKRLQTAYRHWREFLKLDAKSGRIPDDEQARQILVCFNRFGKEQNESADRASRLILAVDRSKSLLESALSWDDASVGANGTQTDQDRGTQWRLVMAWCGLEELIDSIMEKRTWGTIDLFVGSCNLDPMLEFASPRSTKKLVKWREESHLDILSFLDSRGQGKNIIERWLVKGQNLKSKADILVLAQALRHATAHGTLSATKIREWGMREAFDRLIIEIGLVGAAAIEQLPHATDHTARVKQNRSLDGKQKALNLRQPHAEAVIRGAQILEYSKSTIIRGRIYIYASSTCLNPEDEIEHMGQYGMSGIECDQLQRGVILGTAELTDCTGTKGEYHWHFRSPERHKRVRAPTNQPRSTWFTPFLNEGSQHILASVAGS